jgi:hypothetical protein
MPDRPGVGIEPLNTDRGSVTSIAESDGARAAILEELDMALAALSPYLTESLIPAGRLINLVLDVWDVSRRIDASVSEPAERFLSALVKRTTVTPSELLFVVEQTRTVASEFCALASAMAGAGI